MHSKSFLKIMLGAAALLLIPLVAMQFNSGFNWTLSDFVFVWVVLVGIGFGGSMAFNKTGNTSARVIGAIIILLLLWLWAEMAVGIFTNWGS